MHTILETVAYVSVCVALPAILLVGEIKAERKRRRRAEADRHGVLLVEVDGGRR